MQYHAASKFNWGPHPFLQTSNDHANPLACPANALLYLATSRINATVSFNDDIYKTRLRPSPYDFWPETPDLMIEIVQYLNKNDTPFIPLLYTLPIPKPVWKRILVDYAFFVRTNKPIKDRNPVYIKVFDASVDYEIDYS